MSSAAEPWLDTPEPQPRLGWYKDIRTGRIYFSKTSKRGPKRKFGSTGPRPQKVQWQREDDRAYYEAMYGWSSCWFCRYCSCCCKCYDTIADEADTQEQTDTQEQGQTDTQEKTQETDSRCQSADAN